MYGVGVWCGGYAVRHEIEQMVSNEQISEHRVKARALYYIKLLAQGIFVHQELFAMDSTALIFFLSNIFHDAMMGQCLG